jgi:hypothetical protein
MSDRIVSSDESDVAVAFQKRMTRKKTSTSQSVRTVPAPTAAAAEQPLRRKAEGIAESSERANAARSKVGRSVKDRSSTNDDEENRSENLPIKQSSEISSAAATSATQETPVLNRRSIEDSLAKLSRSIDRSDSSLRGSRESMNERSSSAKKPSELSDIDKRIQALQSFLDSAR